ncbi:heterokaryon incompatibility protein-domain-containing protein [Xylaria cf. heliscus]|nr:heterokaryon incompatibility protein-domain-containing protein [Xylaria cf. heliscus]
MQQLIARTRDGFAFGEPDEVVRKNYDYLLPGDCLPLSLVHRGIAHPKYGYRYKLLWDGINSFSPFSEWETEDKRWLGWDAKKIHVALVVISNGPLFVDVRCEAFISKGYGPELAPASTGLHLQFYIPTVATDPSPFIWPAVGKAYNIPTSVGLSQSDLTLATRWLKDCIAGNGKHENCGKADDPPLLPTRVIDVGSSDADTHLYISQDGERSHYVALSHCWGGVVPVMNTTSTMSGFVKGLPSEMPKTFADAIALTRALGQRYLWIDSFCILQDSVEDWVHESSSMDQVYSRALLTISADAAENSFAGFLDPPARNVQKASVVMCEPAPTSTASQVAVHVRRRGDLAFQLPYHDFPPNTPCGKYHGEEEPIVRSKLSTRAWAFQERLLSPRTLHFGPSEMAWECRGLCACECSATNERTSRVTSLLKGSIALQPMDIPSGTPADRVLRTLDHAWKKDIVEEYTRLDISKETDRLSGIAGLATKALTLRVGDQYMAGMWRQTIKASLPWYTAPRRPSRRLPRESNLPTWSWASVSGQIQHAQVAGTPTEADMIDVLDVHYTPDAESPIAVGPQTPASLLASGYLVPVDSVWYQPYHMEGDDTYTTEIQRSCYRIKWPATVALPVNCVAMMDEHKAYDPPYDKSIRLDRLDGMELDSMDMSMLLTTVSKGIVYGLLLSRRSVSGEIPEFERVGFVNGLDAIGEISSWTSSSHSVDPMFRDDWEPEDHGGIEAILAEAGIRKGTLKIW